MERLLAPAGAGCTFVRAAYFMQNLATEFRDEIAGASSVTLPSGDLQARRCRCLAGRACRMSAVRQLQHPPPPRAQFNWVDAADVGALAAAALLAPPPPPRGAPPRALGAAGREALDFRAACAALSRGLGREIRRGARARGGAAVCAWWRRRRRALPRWQRTLARARLPRHAVPPPPPPPGASRPGSSRSARCATRGCRSPAAAARRCTRLSCSCSTGRRAGARAGAGRRRRRRRPRATSRRGSGGRRARLASLSRRTRTPGPYPRHTTPTPRRVAPLGRGCLPSGRRARRRALRANSRAASSCRTAARRRHGQTRASHREAPEPLLCST